MPGESQLSSSWRKSLDMDLEAMELCMYLLCRFHLPLLSGQAANPTGSFASAWLEQIGKQS